MVSKKRNKWKGWIKEEDVPPEILEKIRKYYEVYRATADGGPGSANHFNGHRAAQEAVQLTPAEEEIRKRLDPFGSILGHTRLGD